MKLNLANRLTLTRILLIPFFMGALLVGNITQDHFHLLVGHVAAFCFFGIASITDWLDGKIARKYNMVTTLGQLLDPVADKVLVASAFIAFVELGIFPAWMISVILAREFLVTGLRLIGTAKQRIISADKLGKHKTLSQVITIQLTLLFVVARDYLIITGQRPNLQEGDWQFSSWSMLFLKILLAYCVVLTVWSGIMYLYKNFDLLRED
ncbi:MAG: CDP-diacylglycerol--glycerol-3-phosphate 3-phosphatidyltransferase [Myxococcota bacterium]|jgi:CDP-diacylglycerol--glycerol-3-phosphate 3-phosphatidyltransferase|nr:CDP-diacylglycerol--glycerol-3-phosphate 3-phosphatidyltransferase [Myxococcota bacterium]